MTPASDNLTVLDETQLNLAIERMAQSIAVRRPSTSNGGNIPLAIVGLLSQGDIIARRIAEKIARLGGHAEVGAVDITLYRDDIFLLESKPSLRSTNLPFSTDGMRVVLVDDVLNTGRTIRAALNAIFDYGRPASIELACLIDRGGREVPIQPDHVGHTMTNTGQKIIVNLRESNGIDLVTLQSRN